ncbi:MAG: DNA repair protein RadA [Candidatus Nanopelagicales bacterium]|nr:DNA repair protein RadA [Candidatus Nanopelagicales bacterium]
MAQTTTSYRCGNCGAHSIRWVGRCNKCREYGTVAELANSPGAGSRKSGRRASPGRSALPMSQISGTQPTARLTTGVAEFDRVLGGGLVAGQVVLLTGEPGAGKSTLVLQIADAVAERSGKHTLYLTGEESAQQISVRARRIGAGSERMLVADDTDLSALIGHIEEHSRNLSLVIVDSVQTIASSDLDSRAGGVAQVMEVTQVLTRIAKSKGIPICLVGQVTKESIVAGPRAMEHTVDTTLSMEGDRHTSLRLLRAIKNRYGPTDEVACFEHTDSGLREVPDPSALFLGERDEPVPGTCVTVTIEGRRALVAEVQALLVRSSNPNPRRGVSGLDSPRVGMLSAVTERTMGLHLATKDLYVATIGGMRLTDPGTDLAICVAIATAARDVAPPTDVAAIGEVTLSGDIRPVPMIAQRITEATRLGYTWIFAPPGTRSRLEGAASSAVIEAPTLAQALHALISRCEISELPVVTRLEDRRPR